MKISIIIPNYNGDKYLASCLDSLIAQRYGPLEIVLVDGGSTDDSQNIISAYRSHIAHSISEPDNGQSDAINKGIALATGDIISYLNSDDRLAPNSLERVSSHFATSPKCRWLAGACRVFGEGTPEWKLTPEGWISLSDTVLPWNRPQRFVFPQSGASFMRTSLVKELGPYDTTLHYSMDMEYYARAAFLGIEMEIVSSTLAEWRIHSDSKTWKRGLTYGFRKDEVAILERFISKLPATEQLRARAEVKREGRAVAITEAMWNLENVGRLKALKLLATLARRDPRSVLERAWLGAIRRAAIRA